MENRQQQTSHEPRKLPYQLLKTITNSFAEERLLGRGASGTVYKGVHDDGKQIAVKVLHNAVHYDDEQFQNEFQNLARLKHPNVVQLVGYCNETEEVLVLHNGNQIAANKVYLALCMEYVHNGSLEDYISDKDQVLNWHIRYNIIMGICEGLKYLHEGLKDPILHLDLKPANILLDKKMVPKIADFGISKLLGDGNTRSTHSSIGTCGYLPPEYIEKQLISAAFDIFSLGVIIMKVIVGSDGYRRTADLPAVEFVKHALNDWKKKLKETVKPKSLDTICQQVHTCIELAWKCLERDRRARPTIKDIVLTLKESDTLLTDPGLQFQQTRDQLNILERIVAGTEEPCHLDFLLLQMITENFSQKNLIGVGGCGEVYQGILQNRGVAVKRLFASSYFKDKMFHRKVKSLITVRHQDIVRFFGYCSFTEERHTSFGEQTIVVAIRERLLCFEYMSYGSLESLITDELRGLEWHIRYEIIVGICKGLLYLHKEKGIIHMDLKPANILLDYSMMPKITDFGPSRLENDLQTATTRLISSGYCAPEYVAKGISSIKSDIYSLGVIITEVVTGSKRMSDINTALRRWRHRWTNSSKHTPMNYLQVTKCLELAQRCTKYDPMCRPNMPDILDELNEKDGQFQDMLEIEPLEILFPFELYWQVSHTVVLSNDTDDHFAFLTKPSLHLLQTEPDKGIVPPRSECSVTVTMMQPQFMVLPNNRYKEEITVLSTIVDGGLAAVDITKDMFIEKEGKVVDEVDLMVFLGRPPSEEES